MFFRLSRPTPRTTPARAAHRYRPRLESLEARETPAAGTLDATFGQLGLTALPSTNVSLGSAALPPPTSTGRMNR